MKKCVILLAFSMFLLACWDNTTGPDFSDGSPDIPQQQTANAVRITLTYWRTTYRDGALSGGGATGLDPEIRFNVSAMRGNTAITNRWTALLLDSADVGQSWSGSSRSAWIPFDGTAETLRIRAEVMESDGVLFGSDDISPNGSQIFSLPVVEGRSGSATLGTATTTQSEVRFNYEFTRQ